MVLLFDALDGFEGLDLLVVILQVVLDFLLRKNGWIKNNGRCALSGWGMIKFNELM